MSKPVLFEQGSYQLVQSDAKEGVISSYDVINKETGNIERQEPGLGYAVLWVKHLDYMLEKSKTTDPDKEAEAERQKQLDRMNLREKASQVSFPAAPTDKKPE